MNNLTTCLRLLSIGAMAIFGMIGPASGKAVTTDPLREAKEAPQCIKSVDPIYPREMRTAGLEGTVTLEFTVTANGQIIDPEVVASNNPWFERPALETILQWRFRPGRANGRTVDVRCQQTFEFRVIGGEGNQIWEMGSPRKHGKLPEEIRWDIPPMPVKTNFPVYPFEALLARKSGKVELGFLVNEEGLIIDMELLKADTPEFGAAVIAAMDGWQFEPAKKGKTPCAALLKIAFKFEPAGDPAFRMSDEMTIKGFGQNAKSGHGYAPISKGMEAVLSELKRVEPRIHQLNTLDAMPNLRSGRSPIYPSALLATGQAGEAVIEFYIDKKGDAQLPRIVSATAPEFGFAAVQAVATGRFEVPLKDGKPVIAKVRVPVQFSPPASTTAHEIPVMPAPKATP